MVIVNQIFLNQVAKRVAGRAPSSLLILVALITFFAGDAFAVVIDVGDGSGNTTAPEDDPGFLNVGVRGDASAVYLGNRWAVTASHVGAGTVQLDGEAYSHIPSETVRLSNPEDSGLSEFTDLILFRLEEDPGLPSVRLPCNPTSIGSEITLIGGGHDRDPNISYWNVQVEDGDNNDIWTQVDTEAESNRQGYATLDQQTIRWGQSLATLTNFDINSGFGDVLSFQSSFDPALGVDNLGQGVRGDSGGAVFQNNQDIWELIGVIHAVGLFENQPGGTRSAFYGGDTFIADLFRYADEIRAIANFEPEVGDANANGVFDAADIDALIDAVRATGNRNCHFDLDSNRSVNEADLTLLLASAGTLLGDSNLDGEVGFADFLQVSRSFGTEVTGWSDGDFDGDGQVTFADFLILSESFGQSVAAPVSATTVSSVPEPATNAAMLLVFGLIGLRYLRRANLT